MPWPWPAPDDDGGAAHLQAGTQLPDIALPATSGARVSPARIAGRAVLFIYPYTGRPGTPNPPGWDEIPGAHGSTPEAEGFARLNAEFARAGISVFGLSAQSPADQAEFRNRMGLPFNLLSDHAFAFATALQLPTFQTGGIHYLKRLTILAEDGLIARVIYPVHPPDMHADGVLKILLNG